MNIRFVAPDAKTFPDISDEDLADPGKTINLTGDASPVIDAVLIPHGTKEGNPTVIFRAPLGNGQHVYIETTAKLIAGLAAAIRGRFNIS